MTTPKMMASVTVEKGKTMTNAEKFVHLFGLYATELWSKSEKDFLIWLNAEYENIHDANIGELIDRQAAIDVEGIDEQIRCEMCRNPMHTDRGCDGNCKYDEKLYERIMQILGERIKPFPEPRKGKWIQNDNGTWSCNQCNSWIPDEQHYYANWCLYCGADMREG